MRTQEYMLTQCIRDLRGKHAYIG